MMTIVYYQGALDKYKDHAIITRIIKDSSALVNKNWTQILNITSV